MEDFTIYVNFKGKDRKLSCTTEYESAQIMRIRVHGEKSSILIECNYPAVKLTTKQIKWQLKTPEFEYTDPDNAQFFASITTALRSYLRGDHNKVSAGDYLRANKR